MSTDSVAHIYLRKHTQNIIFLAIEDGLEKSEYLDMTKIPKSKDY